MLTVMTDPMPPAADPRADAYARGLSLWFDTVDDDLSPRPCLPGDREADVVIVGAGYTGLWTAHHLLAGDPTLRVVLVEKEIAGFGASGRNGGWCSALFPVSLARLAAASSREAAVRMQRVLHETVSQVGQAAAAEGIDADFTHGGSLTLARNPAQLARLRAEVRDHASWGFGAEDHQLLDAAEVAQLASVANVLGGSWTPHCAALHPAKLVRGLAHSVQRRGAALFERTEVDGIGPGAVHTRHGSVRADHVLVATEGYTPTLPGRRRDLAPVYSLMVATEPLAADVLAEIGLVGRPTFADGRHVVTYGQRTADGRIALGARGAPYHFGSRVHPRFDRDERVHAGIEQTLVDLFPALRGVAFTHRWGGNLGVPRDWFPCVRHDPVTGLGFAGGYVGDGVATSYLAGRTLAAMVLRDDPDDLASLPWAGRSSRRWEPEPLRWLGINGAAAFFAAADRREVRTNRPSRGVEIFWRYLAR